MPQNIQHTINDSNLIAWFVGMASTAVIFFLAWGLKDVKARYDKVPVLEQEIVILKKEIDNLKERLLP